MNIIGKLQIQVTVPCRHTRTDTVQTHDVYVWPPIRLQHQQGLKCTVCKMFFNIEFQVFV